MRRKYLPLLPSLAAGFALIASCAGGGGTGPSDGDSGPPNQVTIKVWNYMGTGSQVFVAVQDGSGSFTKLTASSLSARSHETPTTYTFQVNDPSKKYGVIVVCKPPAGIPEGYASFATLDEIREMRFSCGSYPLNENLSGSLNWKTASTTDESAEIYWGEGYQFLSDSASTYSVDAHRPSNDLIAVHKDSTSTPDSIWIGRNVGSGTQNIDFNSSSFEGVDNTQVTLDCPSSDWPSGANFVFASLNFLTAGGTLYSPGSTMNSFPFSIKRVVPSSLVQPGDRFYYNFFATDDLGNPTFGSFLQLFKTSPADYTCSNFPPTPNAANFTDPENNGRVNISFDPLTSLPSNFNDVAFYTVLGYMDTNWTWNFTFSQNYIGNTTTFPWEFPDLSSLSGWDSNWTPHHNPSISRGKIWYWAYGGGSLSDFRDCYILNKKACPNDFLVGYSFVNN